MNVARLLITAWPDNPVPQCWPFSKESRKFIAKLVELEEISLAELIDFSDRDDTPSVCLSRNALSMVIMVLFHKCRSDTKERAEMYLRRSLSLIPRYPWADHLKFTDDGFSFTAVSGDYDAEIKRIRKQILES